MAIMFALFSKDPNLLGCDLTRFDGQVRLADIGEVNSAALGWYAQDDALMQRFSQRSIPAQPSDLSKSVVGSCALLYHAGTLPVGLSLEENCQPLRLNRWFFAHAGPAMGQPGWRAALMSSLPESIRRQVHGQGDGEVAFACFLRGLPGVSAGEERLVDVQSAMRALSQMTKLLKKTTKVTQASTLNFLATNGLMLLAVRHSEQPLYYTLLEGSERCDECGIRPGMPDTIQLVRAHRQRRAVVFASHPTKPDNWVLVPPATIVGVDRDCSLHLSED